METTSDVLNDEAGGSGKEIQVDYPYRRIRTHRHAHERITTGRECS